LSEQQDNEQVVNAIDFKQILSEVKDPRIQKDMTRELERAKTENLELTSINDKDLSKSIEYVSRNNRIWKKVTTYEPLDNQKAVSP